MNRIHKMTFRLLIASLVVLCFVGQMQAQTSSSQQPAKPADSKPDQKKAEDPFAPEQAPPLPAGMTGSDANDPRAKLKPGLFDAGEISLGLRHLQLLKKPDAFQLDFDPNNPKVQKTLGMLGVAEPSKMPKPMQLVIAQLAFANSDLAFQGHYLFQGNFSRAAGESPVGDINGLSGWTGRCFGLQELNVHVGRDAKWPHRLRHTGISTCTSAIPRRRAKADTACAAKRSVSRRKDFRYIRHQKSQADCRCANLPRLAHPYTCR